ncbi:unnamed protein product [Ambrosiozyma monospora]|uniref:Unnamed protein product n=1 Tax=Ambrosiozyma monospora TaxID=43982 RepID=A0ACB5T028_AMBMO|nr:unnamed protein product [Ambrosiozyma monospora]
MHTIRDSTSICSIIQILLSCPPSFLFKVQNLKLQKISNTTNTSGLSLPELKVQFPSHAQYFVYIRGAQTPVRHALLIFKAYKDYYDNTDVDSKLFFPYTNYLRSEIRGPEQLYYAMWRLLWACRNNLKDFGELY